MPQNGRMGAPRLHTPVTGNFGSGEHRIDREERRRLARTPLRLFVLLEWGGSRFPGRTVDFGVGGVFVQCETIPAYGTAVTVVVDGAADALRFPATVRWADATGVGLQFDLLGARETHFLTELLRAID